MGRFANVSACFLSSVFFVGRLNAGRASAVVARTAVEVFGFEVGKREESLWFESAVGHK